MLYASVVFPKLELELQQRPELLQSIPNCLLECRIKQRGQLKGTWFILLMGRSHLAKISMHQPPRSTLLVGDAAKKPVKLPPLDQLKRVKVEMEDADMLKMLSGGMNGIKAYNSGKMKISGDLILARQLEHVFVKAGGVRRVMDHIKLYNQQQQKSKL